MSIPSRHCAHPSIVADQRTFFTTSGTWGKRNLLQSDQAAQLLIATLYEYREGRKYLLHDFVVMPDHIHLLLTVGAGVTIERAMQFIKGGFSFRAGKQLGWSFPAWQRGFSEVRILDDESYLTRRRYLRDNPVRRGLVAAAELFPYSSANPHFELDPAPSFLVSKSVRSG